MAPSVTLTIFPPLSQHLILLSYQKISPIVRVLCSKRHDFRHLSSSLFRLIKGNRCEVRCFNAEYEPVMVVKQIVGANSFVDTSKALSLRDGMVLLPLERYLNIVSVVAWLVVVSSS